MSEKISLKELAMAEKAVMDKRQSGEEIPDVSVPLPSRGLVYSPENVLYHQDTIDVRAMTAKDEDILSSPALLKKGQALTQMMKACITNKLIDPESMLIGDRNAVLIAIRNCSYGSEYPVEMQCQACDNKFEHTFDMGRLPITQLSVDPIVNGTNAFRYVLPKSRREVIFKLMTGRDVTDLSKITAQMKKANIADNNVTLELHHMILSIDGEEDRTKLLRLVENMHAQDSLSLRDYIQDINPGVDMYQEMTCPSCDTVQEVDVPLGVEFFWPARRRRKRR